MFPVVWCFYGDVKDWGEGCLRWIVLLLDFRFNLMVSFYKKQLNFSQIGGKSPLITV